MKKLFMLSGVLAPIIYVATVILGGLLRPGYSHVAEAISELVAAGAPNRPLLSALFILYNVLSSAFGLGLFLKDRDEPYRRASGLFGSLALVVIGILGVCMELFFPQDPGGIPTTSAGTMHIVFAGIVSLGTMVAILLTAFWFRNSPDFSGYVTYSLITVAMIFVSGGLTAVAVANNHPLLGLSERITIGAYIQWLFVIGITMYRFTHTTTTNNSSSLFTSRSTTRAALKNNHTS